MAFIVQSFISTSPRLVIAHFLVICRGTRMLVTAQQSAMIPAPSLAQLALPPAPNAAVGPATREAQPGIFVLEL